VRLSDLQPADLASRSEPHEDEDPIVIEREIVLGVDAIVLPGAEELAVRPKLQRCRAY
jgi:hypothetical protein